LVDDETKQALGAESFQFLTLGQCVAVNSIDDKKLFDEMMESFINIKLSKEEMSTILSILSAILFLGNVSFDKSTLTD
jgi:myosin-5